MFPVNRHQYAVPIAGLVGALIFLSTWVVAGAHTQGVCSVPGDHATIQAAVDDAACETVNLGAGTFYESVTISRTVTLQGQGEDLTIVEGDINYDSIFIIQDSGVVTITGMTLQNLQAGPGSAILNGGAALVADCTLSGNSSWIGGGIANGGTMIVAGSTLSANTQTGYPGGGGGIANWGTMTVTDSTLNDNSTTSYDDRGSGGGIFNAGTMTLINSTLSGNSADSGGGIYNEGTMTVTNSTLSGNSADSGGGMYNSGGSPTLTDVTFSDNSASAYGGGMSNRDNSSPRLTNVTFSRNNGIGGGGMHNSGGSPRLTNVTFSGNFAGYLGGGMLNMNNSSPTLTNLTFSGNQVLYSGAGGGMYNDNSNPTLANSILWGNTGRGSVGQKAQIYNYDNSTISVTYSLVGGGVYTGTGNISADPLFVDVDGPDDIPGTPDDDLRLDAGSPAIDAGDNSALPPDTLDLDGDGNTDERLPYDLDGNPRVVHGTVDMGAYEAQLTFIYLPLVLRNH